MKRVVAALGLFIGLAWSFQGIAAEDWESQPPWAAPPPWPSRVTIEKPDPVFGDRDLYETWVYTEQFASRFTNLPPDRVSNELPPGLQAIAFRIYKAVFGDGWLPKSPLYHCALDLYFDNSVDIPAVEPKTAPGLKEGRIATGSSVRRLMPKNEADIESQAKDRGIAYGKVVRNRPVIFYDGQLDAQYAEIGAEFRENVFAGLNLVSLNTNGFCTIAWPVRKGQRQIVSLTGNDPYTPQKFRDMAREGGKADRGYPSGATLLSRHIFDLLQNGSSYSWQSHDVEKGLFALPPTFTAHMLDKAYAAKTVNRCIEKLEGGRARLQSSQSAERDESIASGCHSLISEGKPFDAYRNSSEFIDHWEKRNYKIQGINK